MQGSTVPPGAPITPAELADWRARLGRAETRHQVLDVESLRRFAAAVGADLDVERRQPLLAHWAYFLEACDAQRLGRDGHALRDRALFPPERLPRRMFAATRIRFHAPLTLQREAELTLTPVGLEHRVNADGDMVFVEVDRHLRQSGVDCVIERQTLVYRAPPQAAAPSAAPAVTAQQARMGEQMWVPGRIELFRFSAATFNSHRIHYDLPYARDEEGYPDLVVQGPLTAVKLLALVQDRLRPTQGIAEFAMRARAPLFVEQPVLLAHGEDRTDAMAIRCDGMIAMTAHAEVGGD